MDYLFVFPKRKFFIFNFLMFVMKRGKKSCKIPVWVMDGFVGILALMIYNFALYLIKISEVGGFFSKMEDAVGYFGVNSFVDFGFSSGEIIFGVFLFFLISFLLGVVIGDKVRKRTSRLI